jgi:8-amino-7-oxononanoate synthase
MESAPGPETVLDGVRYLYFAGTSYLGLAGHPEVIEAGCAALRKYGVHSATTRARFGSTPPVLEVERRAAEYFGTEDAFYFASGYVANHILVSALASRADAICLEASAHYSVQEAARLANLPIKPFRGGDAEDLARASAGIDRVLVLADAVGPATGRLTPVAAYLDALRSAGRATVLLDDAHGVGVLGENGRGLLDELGLWTGVNGQGRAEGNVELCVVGTLAKALGGFGGVIPGSRAFVGAARGASHYFDGASAPASAVAGASAKALELVMQHPELRRRLRGNVLRLRAGLRELGVAVPEGTSAHVGVSIGTGEQMCAIEQELKRRGIIVPYLASYSGSAPQGVLRMAVFANHSEAQIDRLLAALREIL